MVDGDGQRVTRHCVVTGHVQGVWFRASTRDRALELGLEGRARNLPDGGVEVVVTGPAKQVDALCEWLWRGSLHSRVEKVTCRAMSLTPYRGFVTA